MIYLYLGYLSTQIYSTYSVIVDASMPFSALIFSIVVLLIFSFIPILGYVIGYMYGFRHRFSNLQLLLIGCGIGWVENAFFYFELFNRNQLEMVLLIATITFFAVNFININKKAK